MSSEYDISIVIAAYNEERYIEECLDSIISQTFGIDRIEVLVIDDGSTDKTYEILLKYDSFKNIKIHRNKENSGVAFTRNKGIGLSNGKYLMILDGDDFISENATLELYNFMEKHSDEIDIAAYEIMFYRDGVLKKHPRSAAYEKGSGIYDVNEYFNISQATVNVIFKNRFEHNYLYNTNMKVEEDNEFNTRQIMLKGKIGYCKSVRYFYRKHIQNTSLHLLKSPDVGSVLDFHENLVNEYMEGGTIPRYVQGVILRSLGWRIKKDAILPYYYIYVFGEEVFDKEVFRLKKIMTYIDPEVIFSDNTLNTYHRLYFARLRSDELELQVFDGPKLVMKYANQTVSSESYINIQMNKCIFKEDHLVMNGYIKSGITELVNPEILIEIHYNNGEKRILNLNLFESAMSYYKSTLKTNTFLGFDEKINIENVKKFFFRLQLEGGGIPVKLNFSKFSVFNRKLNRFEAIHNNILATYHEPLLSEEGAPLNQTACIQLENISKVDKCRRFLRDYKKYDLQDYKMRFAIMRNRKKIWIYIDSEKGIDNSYYQFLHDFEKNDKVERFYIKFKDTNVINNFEREHTNNIVEFGSEEYKSLMFRSNKIFMSNYQKRYLDLGGEIANFADLIRFDVYYLGNQIFNDESIKIFSKASTMIDYFVISSDFEKSTLINKYNYKEDLFITGMPKQFVGKAIVEKEKSILFSFSNRLYLDRLIKSDQPLNIREVNYFNNLIKMLKSEELSKSLSDNKLRITLRLPVEYKDFGTIFGDDIDIVFGDINTENYKMLVTDFDPIQFDFVMEKKPIVYYVPDILEFFSGMHSFKSLKSPFEEAFGNLFFEYENLVDEIIEIIEKDFQVDPVFVELEDSFYNGADNPAEAIYKLLQPL